jgi:hypothetical protein
MKRTLADLARGIYNSIKYPAACWAMGVMLATAPVPTVSADPNANARVAVGLSSPCHGLLALRGIYDFNDYFGIEGELGIGFSGVGARIRKGNLYGYAGVMGISPWMYLLPQASSSTGPAFGLDLGVGIESNSHNTGLSVGIEGGLVIPIPPESNTQAFRVDVNLMYRF